MPFEENLRAGRAAPGGSAGARRPGPVLAGAGPPDRRPRRGRGGGARPGRRAHRFHRGAGLLAKDVLDLQLGVDSLDDADARGRGAGRRGLPAARRASSRTTPHEHADDPDPARWPKRLHGSADPGRRVNLHVRERSGPAWRYAVRMRDWLRADPGGPRRVRGAEAGGPAALRRRPGRRRYVAHKEPWFDAAVPRMAQWAASSERRRIPEIGRICNGACSLFERRVGAPPLRYRRDRRVPTVSRVGAHPANGRCRATRGHGVEHGGRTSRRGRRPWCRPFGVR